LDWTALPVGKGFSLPATAGLLGFLDFVGYPVGGATGLVIFHGHGAKVGGKPSAMHLFLLEAMYRQQQRKPKRKMPPILAQKTVVDALQQHAVASQQKRMAEQTMYAVALAKC
jgi:hypothetical protein